MIAFNLILPESDPNWIFAPYKEAWAHFQIAFSFPDESAKEPAPSLAGRVQHLCTGILLSIPVVNLVMLAAMKSLGPKAKEDSTPAETTMDETVIPVAKKSLDEPSDAKILARLARPDCYPVLNVRNTTLATALLRPSITDTELASIFEKLTDSTTDIVHQTSIATTFAMEIFYTPKSENHEILCSRMSKTDSGLGAWSQFLATSPPDKYTQEFGTMLLGCVVPNTPNPTRIYKAIADEDEQYFFSLLNTAQFQKMLPTILNWLSPLAREGLIPASITQEMAANLNSLTAEQLDIFFHSSNIDVNKMKMLSLIIQLEYSQQGIPISPPYVDVLSDHTTPIEDHTPSDAYRFIINCLRYHPAKAERLRIEFCYRHEGRDQNDRCLTALKQPQQENNPLTVPFILTSLDRKGFASKWASKQLTLLLMQGAVAFIKPEHLPLLHKGLEAETEKISAETAECTPDNIPKLQSRLRVVQAYHSIFKEDLRPKLRRIMTDLQKKRKQATSELPQHSQVKPINQGIQGRIRYETVQKILTECQLEESDLERHQLELSDVVKVLLVSFKDKPRELHTYPPAGQEENEALVSQLQKKDQLAQAAYSKKLYTHIADFIKVQLGEKCTTGQIIKFIAHNSRRV